MLALHVLGILRGISVGRPDPMLIRCPRVIYLSPAAVCPSSDIYLWRSSYSYSSTTLFNVQFALNASIVKSIIYRLPICSFYYHCCCCDCKPSTEVQRKAQKLLSSTAQPETIIMILLFHRVGVVSAVEADGRTNRVRDTVIHSLSFGGGCG